MEKIAALYTRLSQVDVNPGTGEVNRAGLITQEQDLRRAAELRGLANVVLYEEPGKSGFRDVRRPRFAEMQADISAGKVGAVLVWKLDRAYRNLRRLLDFVDFCREHGAAFIVPSQGIDTSAAGVGDLLIAVLGAVAEMESRIKSDRQRAQRARLRAAGRPRSGGPRAFGFEPDGRTPRPDEVRLIRKSGKMIAAGESMRAVALMWKAAGLRSPSGAAVSSFAIRRVLLSGRFLSEPVATRVRAVLEDPARRERLGSNRRRYLLTGLLRCGKCGVKMKARMRDGQRLYICTQDERGGCGGVTVIQGPTDATVAEAVYNTGVTVMLDGDLGPPSGDLTAEEEALAAAHRDDEARIANLATDYADGALTAGQVKIARERIEGRIKERRRKVAEVVQARASAATWADLVARASTTFDVTEDPAEFDRWRRLVQEVVAEVRILPAAVPGRNVFDPGRVQVTFKDR